MFGATEGSARGAAGAAGGQAGGSVGDQRDEVVAAIGSALPLRVPSPPPSSATRGIGDRLGKAAPAGGPQLAQIGLSPAPAPAPFADATPGAAPAAFAHSPRAVPASASHHVAPLVDPASLADRPVGFGTLGGTLGEAGIREGEAIRAREPLRPSARARRLATLAGVAAGRIDQAELAMGPAALPNVGVEPETARAVEAMAAEARRRGPAPAGPPTVGRAPAPPVLPARAAAAAATAATPSAHRPRSRDADARREARYRTR